MTSKIVFTGGGTAGHVIPNIAIIEALQKKQWHIEYIGSHTGIERQILSGLKVKFYSISTGKLRRYFSWQNFIDPFRVLAGFYQSLRILKRSNPNIVFSKGGFVAFPVVMAAWCLRIPVVVHESDFTPGLANKLSLPFARKICLTFEHARQYFDKNKSIVTGNPIRNALFQGCKEHVAHELKLSSDKPCILFMGGSAGSQYINAVLRQTLPQLTKKFHVLHLCGVGNLDPRLDDHTDYCQMEYAQEILPDLMAAADLIVSRSGANSVYEILALKKPHIFIPLPRSASRGDQLYNAKYFEQLGASEILYQESLNSDTLLEKISIVMDNRESYQSNIDILNIVSGTEKIVQVLLDCKKESV